MVSEQEYYRPRPDSRQYQEAVEKATFLIDNSYIKISEGLTFDLLVEQLLINNKNM
ncbi:hypothetical protein UFOVP84_14 [uncultured Caudovirales phage]|uniref:Uncharacterized protein n=1 Tax=uncultured Caudovirales phage TaxID=2100421 RepID=A0A6J5L089_9CAUD|nr:hypothetical protein UFOVP84_14 [uncultured Caudovirales phage]